MPGPPLSRARAGGQEVETRPRARAGHTKKNPPPPARQQNQPPFLQIARWPCPARPSRPPSKPSVRSDHSSPATCLRSLIPQFSDCHQNQKNEGIPKRNVREIRF